MAAYLDGNIDKVRETCRQLKPFVGTKADELFQAYVAEDETGRQQIQAYMDLLYVKYLLRNLDDPAAALIPPSPEQATGEYDIAPAVYGGRDMAQFGLREDEWIQHVGIFGRTGAGKTNLGFLILDQLVKKGKPVLIFDWKRNYRDLLTKPEFRDAKVYTIGRPIAPFIFNPLIPPPGTNPKTWLKKLNEVMAHAYLLGNGVLYLLQQTLDAVYEDAGVYDGTVRTWPTIQDVLAKAQQLNARGREAGWLSSTLRALATLCFGDMGDLVNQQAAPNAAELLDSTVILELDALTQQDKVFFIEALLLWIHHWRMQEPGREKFKHAILIEEAHHVLSNERRSLVGGQSVMEITFREIREFGESLILLDQHPSQISLPALGNTYCTFCLNLKHQKDVGAMASAMLLDGKEKDILGSLEVGQAAVKLQGRIPRPFMIRIPHFTLEKGSVTDDMIQTESGAPSMPAVTMRAHAQTATLTSVPSVAGAKCGAANQGHGTSEIGFLTDVASYPESGVAARYKRLAISVRQGQKLKAYLAEDELIEEQETRTATGKLVRIRLTEKGRELITREASSGCDPSAQRQS